MASEELMDRVGKVLHSKVSVTTEDFERAFEATDANFLGGRSLLTNHFSTDSTEMRCALLAKQGGHLLLLRLGDYQGLIAYVDSEDKIKYRPFGQPTDPNVARMIGNEAKKAHGATARCDVTHQQISSADRYVILASKGVYATHPPAEMALTVHQMATTKNLSPAAVARKLVEDAIKRQARMDLAVAECAAIVMFLGPSSAADGHLAPPPRAMASTPSVANLVAERLDIVHVDFRPNRASAPEFEPAVVATHIGATKSYSKRVLFIGDADVDTAANAVAAPAGALGGDGEGCSLLQSSSGRARASAPVQFTVNSSGGGGSGGIHRGGSLSRHREHSEAKESFLEEIADLLLLTRNKDGAAGTDGARKSSGADPSTPTEAAHAQASSRSASKRILIPSARARTSLEVSKSTPVVGARRSLESLQKAQKGGATTAAESSPALGQIVPERRGRSMDVGADASIADNVSDIANGGRMHELSSKTQLGKAPAATSGPEAAAVVGSPHRELSD